MSRAWLGALLLGLYVTQGARADDLESPWHAPASCPSAAEADRRLRDRTEGFSALTSEQARVWIDHAPNGELRARVTLLSPDGREERLFYGRDCEALSEAVLLVISMAFEPDEAEMAWGPPTQPARKAIELPPPPPSPPPRAPLATTQLRLDEPRPRPDEAPATSVRIGPVFTIDRGSLPNTGFAGGGLISVGLKRIQLAGGVSYFTRQDGKLGDLEGAHVDFRLITGELRACYFAFGDALTETRAKARKGFALGPCAGVELGGLRGRGEGIPHAARQTGLWAAGLFGMGVSLGPYGRIAPTASLALGLAMRRAKFAIEDAGTLYQARPAFMRATVGLMIELNP